jgi:hypothetical protein
VIVVKIKDKNTLIFLCRVFMALVLSAATPAVGPREIIDYYWQKAAKVYPEHDPVIAGQPVSFTINGYIRQLSRGGKVKTTDSTVSRYYYSHRTLDSVVFVRGMKRPTFPIDVTVPNVFDTTYVRTLYPNDNGGAELAIGFDTDSTHDQRPVGIITIDRDDCTIRRLHAAYLDKPGCSRFSRSFHFTRVDGWVVADSITETAALRQFMVDEDYRIDIVITDIAVGRRADSTKR